MGKEARWLMGGSAMDPMFLVEAGCPVPFYPFTADGGVVKADGKKHFSLAQAARLLCKPEADLRRVWAATIGQFVPQVDPPPPTSPNPPAETLADWLDQHGGPELTPPPPPSTQPPAAPSHVMPAGYVARLERFRIAEYPTIPDHFWREFIQVCWERGWDPIARHAYPSIQEDEASGEQRLVVVMGIEGIRTVADATGQYAGIDEPVVTYGLDERTPVKISVTVYKLVDGQRCPFVGMALWSEYGGRHREFAQERPVTCLERVAEAKALRKAFRQLSQVYVPEEMRKPRTTPTIPSSRDAAPGRQMPTTRRQLEMEMFDLGISDPTVRSSIIERFRSKRPNQPDESLYADVLRGILAQPQDFGLAVPAGAA